MSSSLWFVMPAHGRLELSGACLRQLRRTCDALTDAGLEASAVVIADDANLDAARELGFGTVRQENDPLGRKWNDGYQLAADPAHNPRPVDFVVPIGSDDWIDPELLLAAAPFDAYGLTCFKRVAFVREDGKRLARLRISYPGGVGIRVIPRALLEANDYRPAEEYRTRALDASTLRGLAIGLGHTPRITYRDLHDLQIVDWKSKGAKQLNTYDACKRYAFADESEDPLGELAGVYPAEALEDMRAVYGLREEVAA